MAGEGGGGAEGRGWGGRVGGGGVFIVRGNGNSCSLVFFYINRRPRPKQLFTFLKSNTFLTEEDCTCILYNMYCFYVYSGRCYCTQYSVLYCMLYNKKIVIHF